MRLRDIRATAKAVPDFIESASTAGDRIRSGYIALVLLSFLTIIVCTTTLIAVRELQDDAR